MIPSPLYVQGSGLPPVLTLQQLFGDFHFEVYINLLTLVKAHRQLQGMHSTLVQHNGRTRFQAKLLDIELALCEDNMLFFLDRLASKYCLQTLPCNLKKWSKEKYPFYEFYLKIGPDPDKLLFSRNMGDYEPLLRHPKAFRTIYFTLICAKNWREQVLDVYPQVHPDSFIEQVVAELKMFYFEQRVTCDNLFECLLKLPRSRLSLLLVKTVQGKD
jgi:hypothetical protein